MKKDYSALSFSEKERVCESIFISHGPYWHIYTDGTMMQNIFISKDDFIMGMWCLAAAQHLCKSVRVITFELMGNHIHFILAGAKEDCIKAERLHLPHRRGTLLSDMLAHQQRVLCQGTLATQRATKDRHCTPHAFWLQRHQPAAQKNASARPVCLGRTISLSFPSQEDVCGRGLGLLLLTSRKSLASKKRALFLEVESKLHFVSTRILAILVKRHC